MATIDQQNQSCACSCSSGHTQANNNQPVWKKYLPAGISFILLAVGLLIT